MAGRFVDIKKIVRSLRREDKMELLVVCDDQDRKKIDKDFYPESVAIRDLKIPFSLIDFDKMVDDGDYSAAISKVKPSELFREAIYRGWMLSPNQYSRLFYELYKKGVTLINTPTNYNYCHMLPYCYESIKHVTPTTTWINLPKEYNEEKEVEGWVSIHFSEIKDLLKPFGKRPIIIKDFVKSAKHFWDTACFIPDASDSDKVLSTICKFNDVNCGVAGGLVFRQYVELESIDVIDTHSASKVPASKEYRLFFLDGKPIDASPYWTEGVYDEEEIPDGFGDIARRIPSRFFSMDVAKTKDGRWLVIELGDGQVSSLPHDCDVKAFYKKLFRL